MYGKLLTSNKNMRPQLLIASDFDGTITRQDTLVELLNAFGSSQWNQVQEKVVSGNLSIREGLEAEMASVRASPQELKRLLISRIEVEPTFPPFVRQMQRRGIPLVCLSGGFDLCVQTVLENAGLWPLPFLANRLVPLNGTGTVKWHVEFPYPSVSCSACGFCKGDSIETWNKQGYTTVFVGNGVTDRCAAMTASLTFAKDELARWSHSQKIEAIPYRDFRDIEKELTKRGWL